MDPTSLRLVNTGLPLVSTQRTAVVADPFTNYQVALALHRASSSGVPIQQVSRVPTATLILDPSSLAEAAFPYSSLVSLASTRSASQRSAVPLAQAPSYPTFVLPTGSDQQFQYDQVQQAMGSGGVTTLLPAVDASVLRAALLYAQTLQGSGVPDARGQMPVVASTLFTHAPTLQMRSESLRQSDRMSTGQASTAHTLPTAAIQDFDQTGSTNYETHTDFFTRSECSTPSSAVGAASAARALQTAAPAASSISSKRKAAGPAGARQESKSVPLTVPSDTVTKTEMTDEDAGEHHQEPDNNTPRKKQK